jgi:glycosyltransferase involved in cell wall biosynthesis
MTPLPVYVLVTSARDEERFIESTIRSVVAQTVRPARWVIVSDGSTDGTDEIVRRYASRHPWIEFVRMPDRGERHFAGKAQAVNEGSARLKHVSYEVIGSLDADVSFDEQYFSFLLGKLAADPALGVVGTPFQQRSNYDYRFVALEHVSGACQLFRRRCFDEIGGYLPVSSGGVDHIAVIAARMKGWKTRTFTEKVSIHHREMGSASHGPLIAKFRIGGLDYELGSHPLWELFRTAYQMTRPPFVAGGLLLLAGYLSAFLRRAEGPVSRELVEFRRHEQMRRLRKLLGVRMGERWSRESATRSSSGPTPRSSSRGPAASSGRRWSRRC